MKSANRPADAGDSLHGTFDALLDELLQSARHAYGSRLVGLGVFSSVGRQTMRPQSDIDILVVAEPLPQGRMARSREFDLVEARMADSLRHAEAAGVETRLAPVFKTPDELRGGSLLMLDMTEDLRVLFDPQHVIAEALDSLRARLARLGARRVWQGALWYWDLKPDFRPEEGCDL